MKYRTITPEGPPVSVLGFGCMRFPQTGGLIDRDESKKMLDYAIERGVNYIDTAWPYHDEESEPFTGEYLSSSKKRQNILLATKMPVWKVQTKADRDFFFHEQLKRLKTDRIDFYLLHALNTRRWEDMLSLDILEWAEEKKQLGEILYFGFSFHDEFPVFKRIISSYPGWDFCQIQYNYMNENFQAGTEGLKLAASKDIGVVVMEPLLGGGLVNPPEPVKRIWDSTPGQSRTPAEWALSWVWSHPEAATVLSGMSTFEQVRENIDIACQALPGMPGTEELEIISRVREAYEQLNPVPCTNCRYCMPCPHGVDIPGNFSIYNSGVVFDQAGTAKMRYRNQETGAAAENCIACGECEPKCPQSIPIIDRLEMVRKELQTPAP